MATTTPATSNNQLSGMIAYNSDNESHVIIAPMANSTETTASFNTTLEKTTVYQLVSGNTHEQITKTPPATLTVTELSKNDREEFDIETPDISNVSFALISQYDSSVQPTPDSNTYNIGTLQQSSNKSVAITTPTNSIYDSNIEFNYESNSGPFYSTSDNDEETVYPSDINGTIPNKGTWQVTFDETNSNVNYSKSINSEYNNSNSERPIRVSEFSTFNQNYSLGMDLLSESNIQNYFTLDSITGQPIANPISNTGASSSSGNMSESYRLYDNGFYAVKTNNFSNISSQNYGSYRLQQTPDAPLIKITEDETINSSVTQNNIVKFPIFNANNNETLPTNPITLDKCYSMFNINEETIVPGYNYTASITETPNSGYSPVQDMSLRTDSANTFTLDDSSLLNNANYIEHYVNGTHTLSFAPATLTINSISPASNSNLDLFELNEQRETLSSANFSNGQIKINNNTPTTRYVTDNTSTLNIIPNVFYNSEDTKVGISDELKNNYSASYLTQLVAKNTKDINGSFMKSGNVALDLYNGNSVCNSFFNTNDFEFTATNSTTSNDAEVYRITPFKQLSSINGFSSLANDNSTTPLDFVTAFATVQNLATLVSTNNVFDTAKMLFNLRNLSDSSIYSAAINYGWNLTIPSQYNGKMVTSSSNAFATDHLCFPSLQATQNLINGINNKIDYNISINTDASGDASNSSDVSQLSDYIEIKWSSDGFVSNTNSMIISQELLTINPIESNITPVEVTNDIIVSGKLQGQSVKVYRVTSERQMSYTFELPLRPFVGLTMTTPVITVNTIYYKVKNTITDEYYPHSYTQYISDSLSTDYTYVSETFSSVSQVIGSLNSTDLCDMFVKVQGKDINSNNIIDLTSKYLVSVMYGIEINMELNTIAETVADKNGDITLTIEVEQLSQTGAEGDVLFDNVDNGYMLQLTNKYDTNFIVDYWSANINNITTNTNIACVSNTTDYSNKSLTISNGFSNISQWNTTNYTVKVSYEENDQSTTVLSICLAGSTSSLYEIRTKKFTFLNTQAFISNISKDIYRNDRWIGQNQTSSTITFSEKFMTVDYTYTNGSVNQSNVFTIDTGIYLTQSGLSSTTFKQSDIGKYIKFSLKGDSIGINMINNVANLNEIVYISQPDTTTIPNHTITNHGWSFQYTTTTNVSRILTIPCYRGFYGPSQNSGIQVYTIQRDTMVATLSINNSRPNEILNTDPSIYADGAQGTVISGSRYGWGFSNQVTASPNKINWYYYSKQTSNTSVSVKVNQLSNMYCVIKSLEGNVENPFFIVYTTPTGVNDAASWYHSKLFYGSNALPVNVDKSQQILLFTGLDDPSIHPEIPSSNRQQLQLNSSLCNPSSITDSIVSSSLDEINLVSLQTSSQSISYGNYNFNVYEMGFKSSSYNHENICVTSFPRTISQSFNVYYDKEYSVDNLSGNIGNIGLKIKFLMSMLTPSDTNSFTIYTMGDNVSFTIVNPNAQEGSSYRGAPNNTTLKTFVLDTFTGSNYNGTGKSLSINSYRLKINTSNSSNLFSNTTASWSVEIASGTIVLYKNNSYLGNPEKLDTNDVYLEPDSLKWVNVNPNETYQFIDVVNNGIPIGPWRFYKNASSSVPSISYFVISPPFLKFMKVISNTKTLPYTFAESDLKTSYLPVADTVDSEQTYNPFTASTTYDYITTTNSVSSVTVTFDQTVANDITFVQTSPESLVSSYSSSSRNVGTQYFVVEGVFLKLKLSVGLKTQNGVAIATMFGDNNSDGLPANRLMYCNDNTSYFFKDSLINNNSGIQMKLTQPLNTNTPYPNLSSNQAYSSISTNNANVTIKIDNFFILPSYSLTSTDENSFSLDLPAGQGTKVSMFTHELISNTDGSIDIIVYKYKAINNVDYSNVNNDGSADDSLQSIALTFLEREYKMVSVSSADYAAALKTVGVKPIQSFDTFIRSQASKFESLPWTQDTNWPESNMPDSTSVYASVNLYTKQAQQTIPAKVFATRTDGKAKALLVWKYPFFTVLDKLGRKTFQVNGCGNVNTGSVTTSSVSLNKSKNEPTTGTLDNILKSSPVGWSSTSMGGPISPSPPPTPPTNVPG